MSAQAVRSATATTSTNTAVGKHQVFSAGLRHGSLAPLLDHVSGRQDTEPAAVGHAQVAPSRAGSDFGAAAGALAGRHGLAGSACRSSAGSALSFGEPAPDPVALAHAGRFALGADEAAGAHGPGSGDVLAALGEPGELGMFPAGGVGVPGGPRVEQASEGGEQVGGVVREPVQRHAANGSCTCNDRGGLSARGRQLLGVVAFDDQTGDRELGRSALLEVDRRLERVHVLDVEHDHVAQLALSVGTGIDELFPEAGRDKDPQGRSFMFRVETERDAFHGFDATREPARTESAYSR